MSEFKSYDRDCGNGYTVCYELTHKHMYKQSQDLFRVHIFGPDGGLDDALQLRFHPTEMLTWTQCSRIADKVSELDPSETPIVHNSKRDKRQGGFMILTRYMDDAYEDFQFDGGELYFYACNNTAVDLRNLHHKLRKDLTDDEHSLEVPVKITYVQPGEKYKCV